MKKNHIKENEQVSDNLIIKHNNLIEARYSLTLNEQKILLYSISLLDEESFNTVQASVGELLGLLDTTQSRHAEFKKIAKNLISKVITIHQENSELVTSWLSSVEYLKNKGIIELEFSEKLTPYLLELKEKFTKYELKNVLRLKNKHSVRIYELLKQYEKLKKREFEINEFKKILAIEGQYKRPYDLDRYVLAPAKKEINAYTDLNISYEKIRIGRQMIGILFKIKPKNTEKIKEKLEKHYDIEELKKKMGLQDENFSTQQVMEVYELACKKTARSAEIDVFEYVRLNYVYIKDKARNKFKYLLKAIENDYALAVGQLSFKYYKL